MLLSCETMTGTSVVEIYATTKEMAAGTHTGEGCLCTIINITLKELLRRWTWAGTMYNTTLKELLPHSGVLATTTRWIRAS